MKITSGAINAMGAVPHTGGNAKVKKETVADASFDQITLSESKKLSSQGRLQQEATAKLSQEVRAHNTTGKISEIREQVQSGTYVYDPRETATRMLLLGAVE